MSKKKSASVNSNSPKKAVSSLQKTQKALEGIRRELIPFLKKLSDSSNMNDSKGSKEYYNFERAEAEAAVAMALGTLRYMFARVKGKPSSKNDPIRMDLDKTRKIMMDLQNLKKEQKKDSSSSSTANKKSNLSGKENKASSSPDLNRVTKKQRLS